MAFRMMRYSIAAMQNHLDAGYKELPLVIPMLFYHGCRSPYPYSLCWLDEFAEPAIARKIYSSAFPLVDITVVPDDDYATSQNGAVGVNSETYSSARSVGISRPNCFAASYREH